ncbi:hypothetical protein [Sulfitobacter pacificus]|uniref:Uncharacterized protein n=1 Tax=Sulfitobacter pacificus TaxID=1499314 RepID=A0ABQ5VQY9_9RHOB|nr:hypothetical protein [Sulfitobacter pacificus]GLQ29313.1 hypothetical protein GCM10007927_41170 [Sulfitobacter pacificus]
MLTNAERRAALAELTRIENDKAALSEQLRQERKDAIARKDFAAADRITAERAKLGRAHVTLLNAKRQVNANTTMAGSIMRLKGFADDADRTVRNLNSLAEALNAVAALVRILKALSGAFV